jgi:hypothetical protein
MSDLRVGKIYNKHILFFGSLALLVQISFFIYDYNNTQYLFSTQVLSRYVLNASVGFILSILLYMNKIWAAGDAKLYSLLLIIIPYNLFFSNTSSFFPGFNLLVYTFGAGFLYFAFETLVLELKEKTQKTANRRLQLNFSLGKSLDFTKKFVPQLVLTYSIASLFTDLILRFFPSGYNSDRGLFLLLNVMLISTALKIQRYKTAYNASIVLCSLYLVYKIFNLYIFNTGSAYNPVLIVISAIIILITRASSKYNYKQIATMDVKPGMILSFGTVILFSMSKVKGLPLTTTETTDSRITLDEAESIKRWAQSKRGQGYIVIVRHVPFAPFLLAGSVMQLLLIVKYYL